MPASHEDNQEYIRWYINGVDEPGLLISKASSLEQLKEIAEEQDRLRLMQVNGKNISYTVTEIRDQKLLSSWIAEKELDANAQKLEQLIEKESDRETKAFLQNLLDSEKQRVEALRLIALEETARYDRGYYKDWPTESARESEYRWRQKQQQPRQPEEKEPKSSNLRDKMQKLKGAKDKADFDREERMP